MDGGLDLVGGQAAAAHRHIVPVEDIADRASFDAESGRQFIHCGPGLVSGDQFRDSVGVQLACPPWSGPFRRRLGGCRGVGQLLDQGFQGFYLRVRVRVRSPKVRLFTQVGAVFVSAVFLFRGSVCQRAGELSILDCPGLPQTALSVPNMADVAAVRTLL
ncbi:hypothetical protein OHB12_17150 [Nocardia sp. NBC_01730]|uniref:hypothetical protein n=1 Tax=Nocardia sp. NBC_01730 TaxID=2975998 RepID=UPI002E0EECDE|nr:hypothetical protein OHB12_17150 [Nocardia sp. NBC_01730]